jgi:drug/metabolite transporter (DMT)-like permease
MWGIQPIIHKYIFNTQAVSAVTMMVLGSFIYFVCSFVYFLKQRNIVVNDIKQMNIMTITLLVFSAIIAGFFANYLYFSVIQKHDSYLVSALVFSSPFFTLVFSYLLLQEHVSTLAVIGVISIVFGVILLAFNKK